MAKADVNKNITVTQGFVDKLIDKISNILKEQHALSETDEEQAEAIESLLDKLSSLENNFEELTKSLARGSYPLKLARSIRVAESKITPQITPVAISQAELISTYNEIPSLLLGYINPVSLTPESYRGENSNGIILETTIKGNYWAIATEENKQYKYWLVPNNNLSFNVHQLKTVENLFQLKGDYNSGNSEFVLQEPAIISLLPNNKQWKLLQPGILFFGSNLKSTSLQPKPINVATNESSELKQILSSLTAFKTEVEQLNNKVSQLEIQSEISEKAYQREKQEWLFQKQALNQQLDEVKQFKSQLSNFKTQIANSFDKYHHNMVAVIEQIPQFVDEYNLDKKSLSNEAISTVDITQSSLNQKRLGHDNKLILENTTRKKYWIVKDNNDYYLIPHAKIRIDEYSTIILESLFECINFYSDYRDFHLIQPAKVSQLDSELWQLERKGRIEFSTNNTTKICSKITISQFRRDYAKDKKLILDWMVAKVTISVKTLSQITFHKPDVIVLENTPHGKYWIVDYLNSYFLIPSDVRQMTKATETSLTVAKLLFDLVGFYPQYSNYDLIRPAIVSKISQNQWKLEEKGKFNFS